MCEVRELKRFIRKFDVDSPLDKGIVKAVYILRKHGIETFESCEGGKGHPYFEPTIRFFGEYSEGFRAFSIAKAYNLPISSLRRYYVYEDTELKGPWWEITFIPTKAQK